MILNQLGSLKIQQPISSLQYHNMTLCSLRNIDVQLFSKNFWLPIFLKSHNAKWSKFIVYYGLNCFWKYSESSKPCNPELWAWYTLCSSTDSKYKVPCSTAISVVLIWRKLTSSGPPWDLDLNKFFTTVYNRPVVSGAPR